MLAALARRMTAGLAVIVGVVTLTFFLLRLAPGDPARWLVGPGATPAQLATQRHALGLDRPLAEQYVAWIARAARGDWGTSIASGRPVSTLVATAWPATVRLVGLSLVLSYLLGLLIGAIQAARSGSRVDTALSIVSVTLFALPGYWLGLMLIMTLAYWVPLLPAFGAAGVNAPQLSPHAQWLDALRHLVLPLATLTLIGIGGAARYFRGALLDVRSQPFVTTARAKGLPPARILFHHMLRNALVPALVLLGLSLPALFSGAVFVEAVFAWPGVGRVLVEAVQARDYPVVTAATTISATLVVAGNLLADALATYVDPRTRARVRAA